MNLGTKIVGLFLVLSVWVFVLGDFFTFGIGAYTLWSMATNQPSFIIKQAPELSPAQLSPAIRYVPEVFYLTPSHNNFPGTTQVKSPEDTRFAVTGVGEIFDLRLIKQSDGRIVYLQRFVFDKPVVRGAIFCLFGVEYSTSGCAGIPEKNWQEGDYIFEVIASYASGGNNTNRRLIHFDRWPGR